MAEEHLVFGQILEALYLRGLKGKLTSEHMSALRKLGLDLEKPLLPAYSRKVVHECLMATCRMLYPDLPTSEAMYQVGKHVTPGQRSNFLGNAILTVVGLVGPHRTLERMTRTFRSTNNYMTVTLERAADTTYLLVLEPSNEYPSYMQAVIEDLLTVAGAKSLRVEVESHDKANGRCTYRIAWTK
ncbi:MAG: DUF2378 family protein [Archangium sp.]